MEPEQSVEAAPSADNGNLPDETPNEPAEAVAPTETGEPVTPTEPELFELPDGRKVDAETLSKEWKENFYPEYTRKSQELAKVTAPITNQPTVDNPYADPAYVPKNYEELLQVAEQRALAKVQEREQQQVQARQAVETKVATDLAEIRKVDPALDENALFLHANKFQFRDIRLAYDNMKAIQAAAKQSQHTTVKNIAKRNDPVATAPGATGGRPNPSSFNSAVDYLRSLNK